MNTKLHGGCLYGDIKYLVNDSFSKLYIYHCKQCKNITGSSFASNIFIEEKHLEWLNDKEEVVIYKDPNIDFTKVFCKICGSGLPFLTSDHSRYIIPAGSLSDEPAQIENANIFCQEISAWETRINSAIKSRPFPE
ncbi:MAG: GFA family protein [Arenicella sp.]|nr:GFA family protein [Arenicella sp.]